MTTEFERGVWAQNTHLEVISVYVVLRIRRPEETTKGAGADGGEDQGPSPEAVQC